MKLAIVGSRDFISYPFFCTVLVKYFHRMIIDCIVSGGANGADKLAVKYANEHKIPIIEILPDWKTWGKKAGPIRNEAIVKEADLILAFWDGKSKGTASTLNFAKKYKKPTFVVYF